MNVSKLGKEVSAIVTSEEGKFHPLHITVNTPDVLTYEGDIDVRTLLFEQMQAVQETANLYVGQTIGNWANAAKGLITSQKIHDNQAFVEDFGEKTGIQVDLLKSKNIKISVWFPVGIIVSSGKPLEALRAQFTILRKRIANELKRAASEYCDAVNLQPSSLDFADLGLNVPVMDDVMVFTDDDRIGVPVPTHKAV